MVIEPVMSYPVEVLVAELIDLLQLRHGALLGKGIGTRADAPGFRHHKGIGPSGPRRKP